jgi:hypothetical protein
MHISFFSTTFVWNTYIFRPDKYYSDNFPGDERRNACGSSSKNVCWKDSSSVEIKQSQHILVKLQNVRFRENSFIPSNIEFNNAWIYKSIFVTHMPSWRAQGRYFTLLFSPCKSLPVVPDKFIFIFFSYIVAVWQQCSRGTHYVEPYHDALPNRRHEASRPAFITGSAMIDYSQQPLSR